jgi:hypothetical protein
MKTKQPKAKTKKGARKKSRVPSKKGSRRVQKKSSKSAKWEKFKTAFDKTKSGVTTLLTIKGAVVTIYSIYEFLLHHWPLISPYLHGINYSVYKPQWELWVSDAEVIIEAGDDEAGRKFVAEFKGDFANLPRQVQGIVEAHFGKDAIEKLTR